MGELNTRFCYQQCWLETPEVNANALDLLTRFDAFFWV